MTPPVPPPEQLPDAAPGRPDHTGRRLCRWLLARAGWHLVGDMPATRRLVLVAAPHSSWLDALWGLLMKVGLGLDVRYMIKREACRGPLGSLLRHLGAIPITRHSAKGVVQQMVEAFDANERLWLGITPEGTRKRVAHWKSGFWRIAHDAEVPIFPVAFHYPDKAIHLGPLFETTGDMQADIARLQAFYQPFRGKNRDAALKP